MDLDCMPFQKDALFYADKKKREEDALSTKCYDSNDKLQLRYIIMVVNLAAKYSH